MNWPGVAMIAASHHCPPRDEALANNAVQLFGLMTALVGCGVLLEISSKLPNNRLFVGVVLYSFGLIMMLTSSTLYHARCGSPNAPLYQCLDHVAIFIMIAGSYSPISLGVIGGLSGLILFGTVWSAAAGGIVLRIYWPERFERVCVGLYLLLGWLILPVLPHMLDTMPGEGVALIMASGLIYTLGVAVYCSRRLRYQDALWHACVVIAAALHFAAILRDVVWPAVDAV